MKQKFPKKPSREFLLVDLINTIDSLAEDREQVLENVVRNSYHLDRKKLKQAVYEYGGVKAKKLLLPVLEK
jgi:hypothetical protein